MSSENKSVITAEFAGTVFFGSYAVLFLLFTEYTLLPLQGSLHLPLYPSIFIILFAGAIVGRQFAPRLVRETYWLKLLLLGFLLAIVCILIASLSLLVRAILYDPTFFSGIHHWQDYFIAYGLIMLSITLVLGPWLIPLTGLAAIYFSRRFFPKLKAVEQLRRPPEQ